MDLKAKEKLLVDRLHELEPFAVAFSGGIDSTLLLKIARENEVVEFCAVMGVAPVYFAYETDRGREFCRRGHDASPRCHLWLRSRSRRKVRRVCQGWRGVHPTDR